MGIEVRQIVSRAELECCYDLWGTVFREGREFFQRRLDPDRSYAMETTWGAWVDGQLASAIQIFPYRARCGSIALTVGGIGSVATLPAFRHQGLAHLILRQQILWMRQMDMDLSFLFAASPAIYHPLGWEVVSLTQAYTLSRDTLPPPAADADWVVRPGVPGDPTDLLPLQKIYDAAAGGGFMTRVRSPEYWEDSAHWLDRDARLFIAERNGSPLAYVLAGPPHEGARAVECLALPGEEDAAVALLRHLLATEPANGSVTVRLPLGHPWRRFGTPQPDYDGEMWRLLHPVRLLQRLSPELSRRWNDAGAGPYESVTLALGVGESVFRLRAAGSHVTVLPPSAGHLRADGVEALSEAALLHMILGLGGDGLAGRHPLLARLFPPDEPFLWPADHF